MINGDCAVAFTITIKKAASKLNIKRMKEKDPIIRAPLFVCPGHLTGLFLLNHFNGLYYAVKLSLIE
jgi:hypothetical protein